MVIIQNYNKVMFASGATLSTRVYGMILVNRVSPTLMTVIPCHTICFIVLYLTRVYISTGIYL